jgi:hypothetical protein
MATKTPTALKIAQGNPGRRLNDREPDAMLICLTSIILAEAIRRPI